MTQAEPVIREISDDELTKSARVIRDSFRTVAVEFGLTRENCPTHPSFTSVKQLRELKDKGLRFFGLFLGDRQVGFVAIEKADDNLYYMEKLAVLPGHRHKACGTSLVRFVLDYVRDRDGKTLSIGIIDEHTVLKNWYKKFGFKEITIQKFPHLPFTVCFMEISIQPD